MPNESTNLHELFTRNEQHFVPAVDQNQVQEELPEDLKNRHIRRLETKLQAERDSNIEISAKYAAMTEAQKMRQTSDTVAWEEKARRIYGNDKPENAAASELLVDAIRDASSEAEKRAYERALSDLRSEREVEQREKNVVNSYIEQVEDKYGIDFTSTQQARDNQQKFRELWTRLSPKDSEGNVKEYADPFEVFEIYRSRQSDPAKDFASRGMQRSQPVQESVQDDATTRYLRDNGILDPF